MQQMLPSLSPESQQTLTDFCVDTATSRFFARCESDCLEHENLRIQEAAAEESEDREWHNLQDAV